MKTVNFVRNTAVTASLFLVAAFTCMAANAQTVGTIGIGDITYQASDQSIRPVDDLLDTLNEGLKKSFLETRKFTVLKYPALVKRVKEQGLKLEGFYNKEYKSTELSQAGLDYILTANVTEFGVFDRKRGSSNNSIGLVEIDFKLLGVADATQDFTSSVSAQSVAKIAVNADVNKKQITDQATAKAVQQLVDQVISTLHPIRVMKIGEDSTITLNYGQGVLQPGDTILVYPKGQDIQLDASGEPVGESIATLQVITTQKKFAQAQALSGFERLEKGQKAQLFLVGS